MEEMKYADFQFLRSAIWSLSGISLSDSKRQLVQSRLRSRLQVLGLEDFSAYRSLLQRLPPGHPEWQEFTNSLTTNKTDWFREPSHFDFLLSEFVPRWRRLTRTDHLKVWSAACSTGEEAYTLSMVLERAKRRREIGSYEIVATDIDTEVLKRAVKGIYLKSALNQIPVEYHSQAFATGTGEISHLIKVRPSFKQTVTFHHFNLTETPAPWSGEFDIVFCRNVFIYFSKEVIAKVVASLFRAAARDAVLLIGHSESLQGASKWRYLRPSIYTKGGMF
ncbi:MAG TPA: protein-glutamate O-methyltransferase CheR [Bdellovibrionota bacterium]|nr:protein-glutamate O-methyltransferase CheR [Bdellovibrionota bacterium]